MKKISQIAFAAIAAATMFACQGIEESIGAGHGSGNQVVFTATRESVSPDTKTVRMNDGSTWWRPSDEMSVFYGAGYDGGYKFVSTNTVPVKTAAFTCESEISDNGSVHWAIYPYSVHNYCNGPWLFLVIPTEQEGVEGNFSDNAFPAVARSADNHFSFFNACGGIKFSVTRSDIKSVTFRGNKCESIAGEIRVGVEYDANFEQYFELVNFIDPRKEVTLIAPDGGCFKPGKDYYMSLAQATLEDGFTMVFRTATEKGILVSHNPQEIKRSIFGVLNNIDSKVPKWVSTNVNPEAVDLGLSVKWAPFNVGATKPEEPGDHFSWGETEPKEYYDYSTYKWFDGAKSRIIKYNLKPSSGNVDNKNVLDLEDDAARDNWGGDWRMPTKEELAELLNTNNCNWEKTTLNGVDGYKVTSKKAGYTNRSIFLPAAGIRMLDYLYNTYGYGAYSSSSLYEYDMEMTHIIYFQLTLLENQISSRVGGMSVRPVRP